LTLVNASFESYSARDPDVRLMLQVRDDDAAAFEELMLRYQSRVVTILDHLTGHRGQAEDLAQDVFLRVYRARKSYVPGAKFSTWLFTIANNVASNALRSASRRKEVNLEPRPTALGTPASLDQLAEATTGMMPARRLDKSEMSEFVREAVGQLSERQKMAMLLSKFEEMSYSDIAETMGVTVQAVKSLLSRARENLRQSLAPYIEEGRRPREAVAKDEA
jgi:RNA polymerase sigma-70 factor (ECF subfamily)